MKRLFANAGKKKDKQQQYQQQPPYAGQDYPADTAPHANGVNYGGPTSSQPPPQHQQQYAQGPIVPTHQPYVIMQPLVPPVTQVSNAIGEYVRTRALGPRDRLLFRSRSLIISFSLHGQSNPMRAFSQAGLAHQHNSITPTFSAWPITCRPRVSLPKKPLAHCAKNSK
jgi:hypothetical protein